VIYTDYSNPARITLIVGQGSSGKTTFALRYLLNGNFACRFIFDDRGQAADRLNLKRCGTAKECEAALASRWVCFNPLVMFPGENLKAGFRWFCSWAFHTSKRGPGAKVLFADELWQWCDHLTIPAELENVARTGRVHGLELITATHSPRDYHRDLRRLVTEWICFNTVEPADLDAIRPYFPRVDQAATLPRGAFLAYNRDSGGQLSGRLF
jgi:hypothetical protein